MIEQNFLQALINKPEVILSIITLIVLPMGMFISSISITARRKSPIEQYEASLTRILSNEKITKNFPNDPEGLTNAIISALNSIHRPEPKSQIQTQSFLSKICDDITWDVAGIIGLLVTAVILIMIISSKTSDIPDAVFAGWATILGFYFGRSSNKSKDKGSL